VPNLRVDSTLERRTHRRDPVRTPTPIELRPVVQEDARDRVRSAVAARHAHVDEAPDVAAGHREDASMRSGRRRAGERRAARALFDDDRTAGPTAGDADERHGRIGRRRNGVAVAPLRRVVQPRGRRRGRTYPATKSARCAHGSDDVEGVVAGCAVLGADTTNASSMVVSAVTWGSS
jgi:hypothetical protein